VPAATGVSSREGGKSSTSVRVPGRVVRGGRRRQARVRTDDAYVTLLPHRACRCDAPGRRGAFADERRVVVGDEGEEVYWRRARPRSRCSPRAFADDLSSHRRAHRDLPSGSARALSAK
jgi:hypothetical protein